MNQLCRRKPLVRVSLQGCLHCHELPLSLKTPGKGEISHFMVLYVKTESRSLFLGAMNQLGYRRKFLSSSSPNPLCRRKPWVRVRSPMLLLCMSKPKAHPRSSASRISSASKPLAMVRSPMLLLCM